MGAPFQTLCRKKTLVQGHLEKLTKFMPPKTAGMWGFPSTSLPVPGGLLASVWPAFMWLHGRPTPTKLSPQVRVSLVALLPPDLPGRTGLSPLSPGMPGVCCPVVGSGLQRGGAQGTKAEGVWGWSTGGLPHGAPLWIGPSSRQFPPSELRAFKRQIAAHVLRASQAPWGCGCSLSAVPATCPLEHDSPPTRAPAPRTPPALVPEGPVILPSPGCAPPCQTQPCPRTPCPTLTLAAQEGEKRTP